MLHAALFRLWSTIVRKLAQFHPGLKTARVAKRWWSIIFAAVFRRLGFSHEAPGPNQGAKSSLNADDSVKPSSSLHPIVSADGSYRMENLSSAPAIPSQEPYPLAPSLAPPPSQLEEGQPETYDEKGVVSKSPQSSFHNILPPTTSGDAISDPCYLTESPRDASPHSRSIIPIRPYNIELNRGWGYKSVPVR